MGSKHNSQSHNVDADKTQSRCMGINLLKKDKACKYSKRADRQANQCTGKRVWQAGVQAGNSPFRRLSRPGEEAEGG